MDHIVEKYHVDFHVKPSVKNPSPNMVMNPYCCPLACINSCLDLGLYLDRLKIERKSLNEKCGKVGKLDRKP